MLKKYLLGALLGFALAACAVDPSVTPTTGSERATLEATWQRALVMLPGQSRTERLSTLEPKIDAREFQTALPLVIFSHGCAGIGREVELAMRSLTENGYAVIAPDYFGRPDARTVCPGGSTQAAAAWTGGYYADYVDHRVEEAAFALRQARTLSWVDQRRVYLVGHSMGGATASQWPTADVAGVVILAYDCMSNAQARGLRVPSTVPVLSITDRRDPWMFERFRGRTCGEWSCPIAWCRSAMILGGLVCRVRLARPRA